MIFIMLETVMHHGIEKMDLGIGEEKILNDFECIMSGYF
jgi:hypothetical protein